MITKERTLHHREVSDSLCIFVFIYLLGWIFWGALYFWSMRYHSSNYFDFLNRVSDRFRDFSEVNLAAMRGAPYIDRMCSNYPPLALLLGKLFSMGYPASFVSLTKYQIRNSPEGDLVFTIVFGISVLIIALLTFFITRNKSKLRYSESCLITLLCIFSSPFIFTIDRGNFIIFAYISFLIFILFYDRNELISGIALAICACIKVYPVIFSLVFLFSKKYKGFISCILAGMIGLIVPFFFFEGSIIEQFKGFMESCLGFSNASLTYTNSEVPFAHVEQKSNSFSNIFNAVAMLVFYHDADNPNRIAIVSAIEIVSNILTIALIVIAVFTIIKNTNIWKKLLALVLMTILIPGNTFNYMLIFLHPFIILFIVKPCKHSNIYVALLTLAAFISKNWYFFQHGAKNVSIECVLNPMLLTAIIVLLAFETYKDLHRKFPKTIEVDHCSASLTE